MNLPKQLQKNLSSAQGQMLIIFLLLMVVASAIVLSIASRTITDVRITTTTDQSNKAYFAAEAGIEEALRRIEASCAVVNPCDDFVSSFDNIATTSSTDFVQAPSSSVYFYPDSVGHDQSAQILLTDPNNPAAGSNSLLNNLEVHWGLPGLSPTTAVEVILVYMNGGNFGSVRYAFHPSPPQNGFCEATMTNTSLIGASETRTFSYGAPLSLACGGETIPGTATSVMVRVRPLFNGTTGVPIAIRNTGGTNIPAQGWTIVSTGKNAGTTRKIETTKTFPSVGSLFDYALFNGSNGTLQK